MPIEVDRPAPSMGEKRWKRKMCLPVTDCRSHMNICLMAISRGAQSSTSCVHMLTDTWPRHEFTVKERSHVGRWAHLLAHLKVWSQQIHFKAFRKTTRQHDWPFQMPSAKQRDMHDWPFQMPSAKQRNHVNVMEKSKMVCESDMIHSNDCQHVFNLFQSVSITHKTRWVANRSHPVHPPYHVGPPTATHNIMLYRNARHGWGF
jgi:hypothetical protein